MSINELSAQEKSVLLARAMRWIKPDRIWDRDFYDPANMALAWRVLNWATDTPRKNNEEMCFWWLEQYLFNHAPADAQRLWLDKILELAVEAGLVEVE